MDGFVDGIGSIVILVFVWVGMWGIIEMAIELVSGSDRWTALLYISYYL